MEPMTSLATALAVRSGEAAIDIAREDSKGFLKHLLGPSAEAIGESLAVRHKERMFNNLVEVLARAKKKLADAGVSPKEVPLKIIHPLLEGASLEEDENLREMWAKLLASAASKGSFTLHPSFVDILRQLHPEEGRLLQAIFANMHLRKETDSDSTRIGTINELEDLFAKVNGLPKEGGEIAVVVLQNLFHLGIIESRRLTSDELSKYRDLGDIPYSITVLGILFLASCCQEPKPVDTVVGGHPA